MRIFIIIQDITKTAGTERAVCNLANILIKKHDVCIISTDSVKENASYEIDANINLIHLGLSICTARKIRKIYEYIKLYRKIAEIARMNSNCFFIGTYSLFNVLITFLPKSIHTVGCEHFNYESAGKIHGLIRRVFYKKLNAVVCLSEQDASHYSFIKKERLSVIPNSLSFECELLSDCTAKRIIAVGRLAKQKGFDMLLESAAIMKELIPEWHLDIFGEGEDKAVLIAKIDELQLQNFVSLHGIAKNIRDEYCRSSIMAASSRWEGFSLVLAESQSCGIPAVTFDTPCGPADIVVNNETGFVVPLFDTKALAEKTVELALDENKRKLFGRRAHKLSKRFSSESVAEKWESLIAKLSGEEC